jgi:acyl-CoA thioester hydrolase
MTLLRTDIHLEIPFHDVDSMGIVWHGHYLKYFEIARTALMRRAGMDVMDMQATGCAWPVVTCEVKYIRPLRYGQRVRVEAALEEYEFRIGIAYTIWDEATGERLTRGRTQQLPIDATTGELRAGAPPGMVEAIARAIG